MTVAEELRKHADLAIKEGGMYYSGEYLDAIARRAESEQAENDKLRELVRDIGKAARMFCQAWEGSCSKEAEGMSLHAVCPIGDTSELCVFGGLFDRIRELGVEVDA